MLYTANKCKELYDHGDSHWGIMNDADKSQPALMKQAYFTCSEDKFHKLDKYYDSMRDTTHRESSLGMEDRLLAYQRQLDERSHTEVKLEVSAERLDVLRSDLWSMH